MDELGFVVLRSVRYPEHSPFWVECVQCIQKIYPDSQILIIDDNSIQSLIMDIPLKNVKVIQSEFPGCGELLGYYYFHKTHFCNRAVIMHDSMFLQKSLDLSKMNGVRFLWEFNEHRFYLSEDHIPHLKLLKHDVIEYYQNEPWSGCFGVSSVCDWDYIDHVQTKYNLFCLCPLIKNRYDRHKIERFWGLIAFYEGKVSMGNCSLFGNLFDHYRAMNLQFADYLLIKNYIGYTMIKTWVGR